MKRRITFILETVDSTSSESDVYAHFLGGMMYGAASRALDDLPHIQKKVKIAEYTVTTDDE